MNVAIMQPYFLPYIGYWQLINSVDDFVVYDNIQYTKKGWINRNRYLLNGKDELFTIPLKADSDYLNIGERYLAESFEKEKMINKFKNSYRKAPFFDSCFDVIRKIIKYPEKNLFQYNLNSIKEICSYLDIKTKITISSHIDINHKDLKAQDKVITICKTLKASCYINAIGGMTLYNKKDFDDNNLVLNFIKTSDIKYKQFENEFVPWLSMLDIMMFNSKDNIKKMLIQYELISNG